MVRVFLVFLISVLVASAAFSETLRVRPNGNITFRASVDGPTRVSVVDDRISKIIQADSQFEFANDDKTGDVFLRFIGNNPTVESGHIITESGHTVGFTLRPDRSLDNQTVLINLIGVTPAQSGSSQAQEGQGEGVTNSRFSVNEGGGQSFAGTLTRCVREVFERKIGSRSAGSHRDGLGRYSRGGCKARILTSTGSIVRPQSFHNSRTLAVWVDDVASGGRRWVVVVER